MKDVRNRIALVNVNADVSVAVGIRGNQSVLDKESLLDGIKALHYKYTSGKFVRVWL